MKRLANIALIISAPVLAVLLIASVTVLRAGIGHDHRASAHTLVAEHFSRGHNAPPEPAADLSVSAVPAVPAVLGAETAHHSANGPIIPILMYHHVGDFPPDANAIRRDLTISTQNFTTEVEWLAQQKYHTVTLA